MMKLTVLYGAPTNTEAFEEHYRNTHLPAVAKVTGVARLELTRFVAAPDGGKPGFYRMAELYFPRSGADGTVPGVACGKGGGGRHFAACDGRRNGRSWER